HHRAADGERGHPPRGAGRPSDRAPDPWGATEPAARIGPAAGPAHTAPAPDARGPARPPHRRSVPRPVRHHGPAPGGATPRGPATSRPAARPEPMTDPAPEDAITERIPILPPPRTEPSLGRSSSLMALGSLASRVTGFLRQVALFTVLGATVLNDSYTLS